MTSLKEEIQEIIFSACGGVATQEVQDIYTNAILSKIEKRIDEQLRKICDGEDGWYTCNPQFVSGVRYGYKWSKEMLK